MSTETDRSSRFAATVIVLVLVLAVLGIGLFIGGRGDDVAEEEPTSTPVEVDVPPAAPPTAAVEAEAAPPAPLDDPWLRLGQVAQRTGDLDRMVGVRFIRLLTVHSKTHYFLDGAHARGVAVEVASALETFVNKCFKTGKKPIKVVILPVRRDQLLPLLEEGRGDLVLGNLTVTDERQELVDFTRPLVGGVRELWVTGPGTAAPPSVDGLSGHEVWVRRSSSYFSTLEHLNDGFRRQGRAPIAVRAIEELLEDEDILEMVNAGILPATVVDSHKLEWLWSKVFKEITIHPELALTDKGQIAIAVRKDSPNLRVLLNEFLRTRKVGTTFGNVVINRYYKDSQWVLNPISTRERKRYLAVVDIFKTYADRYDFDYLMLIAQAYQESKLDQSKRSHAGAVGVMQLLPRTAAADPINIPDVHKLEDNVHAGAKYLRFVIDHYFDDPEIDEINRLLLGFAAYNAGPTRIARIRRQAPEYGVDPNRWFGQIEALTARKVSGEPVRYVGNIYKYYLAYRRVRELEEDG